MSALRHRLGAATVAALALATAAACGSSSSGGSSASPSSGSSPSTSAGASGADPALAALVPSALKSAGVVKVATDASYAPNEFFATNSTKTIQGMDVDLGEAIGTELGVKFQFSNLSFDSILGALGSRFDLGMSSFTDTKAREKQVTMVDYFSAGTAFMVPSSSTLDPTSVADLCGKTVAVEKGTTQLDDVTAQAKKCSIKPLAFPDQNGANEALASGRADVVLADSPVNAYAAKQSGGKFKIVGTPYGTAPYGIAVPMGASYAGLAKAISGALTDLEKNGTYTKILTKWGVQAGAVSSFPLDGATS